jgi:selenoprotein W-related protein
LKLLIVRSAAGFCAQHGLRKELLTTFEQDLTAVTLKPGSSGVFEVTLEQTLIFSRKDAVHFPEARELKQLVRDAIDPTRDLGHSDKPV